MIKEGITVSSSEYVDLERTYGTPLSIYQGELGIYHAYAVMQGSSLAARQTAAFRSEAYEHWDAAKHKVNGIANIDPNVQAAIITTCTDEDGTRPYCTMTFDIKPDNENIGDIPGTGAMKFMVSRQGLEVLAASSRYTPYSQHISATYNMLPYINMEIEKGNNPFQNFSAKPAEYANTIEIGSFGFKRKDGSIGRDEDFLVGLIASVSAMNKLWEDKKPDYIVAIMQDFLAKALRDMKLQFLKLPEFYPNPYGINTLDPQYPLRRNLDYFGQFYKYWLLGSKPRVKNIIANPVLRTTLLQSWNSLIESGEICTPSAYWSNYEFFINNLTTISGGSRIE